MTSLLGAGGVERYGLGLLADLSKRLFSSTVVVTLPADHIWYDVFAEHASEIVLLYEDDPNLAPKRLGDLVGADRPKMLIISNSWLGYMLLPYLRDRSPETTVVDIVHAFPPSSDGGFARHSLDHAHEIDLTIAVGGQFIVDWMRQHGRTKDNVEVRYAGIDVDLWKPDRRVRDAVRADLGLDDDVPLVVFVGRFSEEKRPLFAAEVFDRLASRGERFAAVMVGDGPDREKVATFIDRARLQERVRLEGNVAPERVMALFKAADIFLQTSKYEGMSNALMEAMASELCVVAPDVGGHPELVVAGSGILIPRVRGHTAELEHYVSAVGSLARDRYRRVELARSARRHVAANFDDAVAKEGLWRLLERAQDLHRTAPPAPPDPEEVGRCLEQAVLDLRLLEQAPISRRVAFAENRNVPAGERAYRLLRRRGRPLYRWARRRVKALDRANTTLKRWLVR